MKLLASCILAVLAVSSAVAYRPIDGMEPNSDNGAHDTPFVRLPGHAAYEDGISAPTGQSRPSARLISNMVFDQGDPPKNPDISALTIFMGQFVDHDVTLTHADPSEEGCSIGEFFPIAVPPGDPIFDPDSEGGKIIPLTRARHCVDANGVREHRNGITHFVDGSNVYGSTYAVAGKLRKMVGGRLWMAEHDMPPPASQLNLTEGMENCFPGFPCMAFGDTRGNENVVLAALHLLFIREHNLLASEFEAENPTWTDEQLFQEARKMLIAKMQAIVYNEFIPAILGLQCPSVETYPGYDETVDASVPIEFAGAAFRFGHSGIPNTITLRNADRTINETLLLEDLFFQPKILTSDNFEQILLGLSYQPAEVIDHHIVDALRNLLFRKVGTGFSDGVGLDLLSMNIQRGRDLGLASYNDMRIAYGMPAAASFSDITSDPELASTLEALYGSVDDVDVFVGGLAEDHAPTSQLGGLFTKIICSTYTNLRRADRYDFERPGEFTTDEVAKLRTTRLRDIMARNFEHIPSSSLPKSAINLCPDDDKDGVCNDEDNCMYYNPDQADVNLNGRGDACEMAECTLDPVAGNSDGAARFGQQVRMLVSAADDNRMAIEVCNLKRTQDMKGVVSHVHFEDLDDVFDKVRGMSNENFEVISPREVRGYSEFQTKLSVAAKTPRDNNGLKLKECVDIRLRINNGLDMADALDALANSRFRIATQAIRLKDKNTDEKFPKASYIATCAMSAPNVANAVRQGDAQGAGERSTTSGVSVPLVVALVAVLTLIALVAVAIFRMKPAKADLAAVVASELEETSAAPRFVLSA